jgi:hypothetical protein
MMGSSTWPGCLHPPKTACVGVKNSMLEDSWGTGGAATALVDGSRIVEALCHWESTSASERESSANIQGARGTSGAGWVATGREATSVLISAVRLVISVGVRRRDPSSVVSGLKPSCPSCVLSADAPG